MRHKKFDFRTAYIDLLLNVLTGIIFLFVLTTLMIQPKKQDEGVKRDAQYIINAEWNPEVDCDVDLWVRDPNGKVVFFENKDADIMHLERDDLGLRNDVVRDSSGKIIDMLKSNKETWVLRGVMSGEFYVTVHLYSCRYSGLDPLNSLAMALNSQVDLPVRVELIRVNPTVTSLVSVELILHKVWDEVTAFNFILNRDGDMESYNRDPHQLVKRNK